MAKITTPDKTTGDSHTATDYNAFKAAINDLHATAESHNSVLKFDKNKFMSTSLSQSGAVSYTLATTGNVDGMVIRHKILSDGVNPITFSEDFNVFNKSDNDIYPAGLHIFYFNYVAGDVDVAIPTYQATEAPTGDTEDPSVPTGLSESKTDTTINLSWTASTDNIGVTGYKVYLDGVLNQQVAGTSAQITGLTPQTTYTLNVSAIDAAENESAQSTALVTTTNSAPDTTAPTITSATIEDSAPSDLLVVFSEVVNITDLTGLSITGTGAPAINSVTGTGTNTLTFVLATAATNGDAWTLDVAGTNTITDSASNALVATTQVITNNVIAASTGTYTGTGTVDPDYQEVLNHWVANGITAPDSAQQTEDNQWIIDYKATGLWVKEDAVLKLDGNASKTVDAKLTDLKRRVQAVAVGGLTWNATGVKGNGTTGYIRTGFIPKFGTNYVMNNASISVVRTQAPTILGAMFGATQNKVNSQWVDKADGFDITQLNINGENAANITPHLSPYVGLNSVSRNNAADIRVDRATASTHTFNSTGSIVVESMSTIELYILARNNAGTADVFNNSEIKAFTAGAFKTTTEQSTFKTFIE